MPTHTKHKLQNSLLSLLKILKALMLLAVMTIKVILLAVMTIKVILLAVMTTKVILLAVMTTKVILLAVMTTKLRLWAASKEEVFSSLAEPPLLADHLSKLEDLLFGSSNTGAELNEGKIHNSFKKKPSVPQDSQYSLCHIWQHSTV
jgi:ABC-type multidrug transport system fused ATPase/permease subunit